MKRATILSLLFAAFCSNAFATVQEGFHFYHPGDWDLRVGGGYFTTDTNYVNSGQTSKLVNGGSLSLFSGEVYTRFVFSPELAFFGNLEMADAESKGNGINKSFMGITSAKGGVEYRFAVSRGVDLIPEFSFSVPFTKINMDQDTAINSEGVNQTFFNLNAQTVVTNFRLIGSAGYLMRASRSTLAPWSVALEMPFTTSVFGARIFGYESIGKDPDTGGTNETTRNITNLRVNGGSLKFYSINPALIDSEVYVSFNIAQSMRLGLAGGLTLNGANNASGYHVDAALTYRFGSRSYEGIRRSSTPNGSPVSIDPYVDQFHEDTNDGVDQKLFRPAPPPPPAVPPPLPRARPQTDQYGRQPRMRPAAPAADPIVMRKQAPAMNNSARQEEIEQRKLQQQLNDAEMSIELKVDKKRKRKSN